MTSKFDVLRAVAHNLCDSVASGIGLLVGEYDFDIFGEARGSDEGFIEVDFLNGGTTGAKPSPRLAGIVARYVKVLPELCAKHGVAAEAFAVLTGRFAVDRRYGAHVTVTVGDAAGRFASDLYVGSPARRRRRTRRWSLASDT